MMIQRSLKVSGLRLMVQLGNQSEVMEEVIWWRYAKR